MDILYSDDKHHETSEGEVANSDEGNDFDEDFNSVSNVSVDRDINRKRMTTLALYVMML